MIREELQMASEHRDKSDEANNSIIKLCVNACNIRFRRTWKVADDNLTVLSGGAAAEFIARPL
jgi:hypothetical protein